MSDSYSFSLIKSGNYSINGSIGLIFDIVPKGDRNLALHELYNDFVRKSFKKYTPFGLLVKVSPMGDSKVAFMFDIEHYATQEKSEDYFEMVLDFNEIDATLKLSEKELKCFVNETVEVTK